MTAGYFPGLVILDCDGVLIDSEVLACTLDAEIYTAAGYPISTEEVMARFIGLSGADVDALVERDLGRALPAGYDRDYRTRLFDLFRRELKAIAGVRNFLDDLAAAEVPFCVASSSLPERLHFTLELTGLWPHVEGRVFSASMVERGKPAPDLFLLASERMGVSPSRSLVVEDSAAGVTAAKAAGMRAFGFCGGSHCGPAHAQRLMDAGADASFATMTDLRSVLGGFAAVERGSLV